MDVLETIEIDSYASVFTPETQQRSIKALEKGKVVYFPRLSFNLKEEEIEFLSPTKVDSKSKNISYDLRNDKLNGTVCHGVEAFRLKEMIKRYALFSRNLIEQLFPSYVTFLTQARTSFRPVETEGRVASYKKDDSRLHVDSFPANPVKGKRILRLFANVNPVGRPRVWRIGEPFPEVVEKIAPRISKPIPGLAALLKLLKITKDYRTLYDHYMLQIHDTMKKDVNYQKNVSFQEILFPAGCIWAVYTDQVSHAAISGQHLFEQTFYLPPKAMQDVTTTPLYTLEQYFNKKLL